MARRAKTKTRPLWILLTLGALALAVGVGAVLQSSGGDPYRTVPTLDMSEYLNNANSLRGNVYKVKGQIMQSLGYSRAMGRLFSVEVDGGDANGGNNNGNAGGGGKDVVPILVPANLGYINLQKGQRYTFRLEVDEGGILKALDMKKI